MSDTATYDELPYSSKTYRGRHPDRLSVIGTLLGVSPSTPATSRIVELGCSDGGNIIPVACSLPGAKCLGVDLSSHQIAMAHRTAEKLGVTNLELRAESLLDFSVDAGSVDYLLCHGVFSWVPNDVRERIFELCAGLLSEHGIASISYNTLPGWYTRQPIRDLLLKGDDRTLSLRERIQRARETLSLFAQSSGYDFERPYSVLFQNELKRIAHESDSYLFHEFLAEENQAWYVEEFARMASRHGLKVMGDARFSRMSLNRLMNAEIPSAAFKHMLRLSPDQISLEQNMDILFHNGFRETLLCRDGAELAREIDPLSIQSLLVSGYITSEEASDNSHKEIEFRDVRGVLITTSNPLFKTALRILAEAWPGYVSFRELLSESRRRLKANRASSASDEEMLLQLSATVLEWYQRDLVDLALEAPAIATTVSEKPKALAYARIQAETTSFVTNILHNSVELGELERELLLLLDGTRGMAELRARALHLIEQGSGGIREDGAPVTDPERQRELLDDLIAATLDTLRRAGLLMPA